MTARFWVEGWWRDTAEAAIKKARQIGAERVYAAYGDSPSTLVVWRRGSSLTAADADYIARYGAAWA